MSTPPLAAEAPVELLGMPLDPTTSRALLARVDRDVQAGAGGWIVTVNLDILQRNWTDQSARNVYAQATVRVADGMPLVWASRLQGVPLPERVAGSSFLYALCELCARRGWGVFLLGGTPGSAEAAAAALRQQYQGLSIDGASELRFDSTPTEAQLDAAKAVLGSSKIRVIFVGLGSPKQEHLIAQLRSQFPAAWFVGVGGSFSFVAGDIRRAPPWLQAAGLEWAHRMVQDPRRLGKRYLSDNLPFFGKLILSALSRRFS